MNPVGVDVAKMAAYVVIVVCFLYAGTLDCIAGQWRLGIAAIMVGIVQGLVFIGGRT